MGDINDMDTEITGRPLRDPPPDLTRGFCGEHTSIVGKVSATHTLTESHETLLRGIDTKLDNVCETVAEMRRDMAYHSKFWGALAGTSAAAFWWLVGHFYAK